MTNDLVDPALADCRRLMRRGWISAAAVGGVGFAAALVLSYLLPQSPAAVVSLGLSFVAVPAILTIFSVSIVRRAVLHAGRGRPDQPPGGGGATDSAGLAARSAT